MIAFVLSLICCGFLINAMYTKWDQRPIIVSFATTPTPVWELPFPAVTICPETKTNKTEFNITKAYHEYKNLSTISADYNNNAEL